jgi:phosphoribosylformylglycinamidine synthase
MKVAIIQSPGTNCELDTKFAFEKAGAQSEIVWHTNDTLPQNTDLVVIAGGFSYGDYLRSGAIAKFSPIMQAVRDFAKNGGYILGICNGFQILLEMNLLEGAMRRNENLHFISKFHYLKVLNNNNKFLSNLEVGATINIPIAHAEGNYYVTKDNLKKMYDNEQILLQYTDKMGNILNPNGSVDSIAGICNKEKKVFGLMPHPERAVDDIIYAQDGINMLKGFLN